MGLITLNLNTCYRVGIYSASDPNAVTWLKVGFNSPKEAEDWAANNGCYRNVRVETC